MTSSKHRGEQETSLPGITHAANLGFEAGIGIALHTSIPNIFAACPLTDEPQCGRDRFPTARIYTF
jgi:hypothetical protein